MTERTLRVPEEVLALLGGEPERVALEALLLHLIRTGRVSVAWAGKRLGLGRQEAAIRWYTSHGYPFPDITPEELDEELRYAETFGTRARDTEPERTAKERAKLEEALAQLRSTIERVKEETGMTEDELADSFDPNRPFPDDPATGHETSASALAGVVSLGADDEPVFAGTDVPVRDLVEHLKGGDPLNDFTAHTYSRVTREQMVAFLEWSVGVAREATR